MSVQDSVLGPRTNSLREGINDGGPDRKKARVVTQPQRIPDVVQIIQAPFERLSGELQSKIFKMVGSPLISLVSTAFKAVNQSTLEKDWKDFEDDLILRVDYDAGAYAVMQRLSQIYAENPDLPSLERAKKLYCQITEELQILDPSALEEMSPSERTFDPKFYIEAVKVIKNIRDRSLEIMWKAVFPEFNGSMSANGIRSWLKNPVNQPLILGVTELPLSELSLPTIPREISYFTNVTTVDLSDNNISGIFPGTFDRLIHLTELDLSENYIPTLPKKLFHFCPRLENFFIVDNGLTAVPEILFAQCSVIKNVNFTQNFITKLPLKLFSECFHLIRIEFNCNSIAELPDEFICDCYDLEVFSISYNIISDIPENFFVYNNRLISVDFNVNLIANIHSKLFFNCVNLVSVSFSENEIRTIDDDWFETCTKLRRLEFEFNGIYDISPDFCKKCMEISEVNFDGNPKKFRIRPLLEPLL